MSVGDRPAVDRHELIPALLLVLRGGAEALGSRLADVLLVAARPRDEIAFAIDQPGKPALRQVPLLEQRQKDAGLHDDADAERRLAAALDRNIDGDDRRLEDGAGEDIGYLNTAAFQCT